MKNIIYEPGRQTPIVDHAQLLVVGGGIAGLTAAITGRKLGLNVVLVERYGFFGGIATAGLLGTFCGFYTADKDGTLMQIVKGFGSELLGELRERGGLDNVKPLFGKTGTIPYDVTTLKMVIDKLISKYGVRFYLHSQAVEVSLIDKKVEAVILETKEGRIAISADFVIDGTGDGDIAARAGADFDIGANGRTQFPATLFYLGNVVRERAEAVSREKLIQLMIKANQDKETNLPKVDGSVHFLPITQEVCCNFTRVGIRGLPVNGINGRELSQGEVEGRKQALDYLKFVRKYVPGYENAHISQFPTTIGIRETRRIHGLYELTEEDLLSARKFSDAIGCNAWPIELHEKDQRVQWKWLEGGEFYQIPYRSLVVKGFFNLMAIGRCLSTTHIAQASTRVIGSCIIQGQGAAVAVLIALQGHSLLKVDSRHLRLELQNLGVFFGD